MWKYMIHPNALPLLGITTVPFQLVSDWMSGGDLPTYIENHPDADRLRLVSVLDVVCITRLLYFQIYEVAKGLSYLHHCNVIHGDLKGVRDPSKRLP
jgi:serine/threonine protein kinase